MKRTFCILAACLLPSCSLLRDGLSRLPENMETPPACFRVVDGIEACGYLRTVSSK